MKNLDGEERKRYMRIKRLVAESHAEAKGLFEREYQRKFGDELIVRLQNDYDMDLSQKQISNFDKNLWELVERWNQYEGRRIKLGKFLNLTVDYAFKFVRDNRKL